MELQHVHVAHRHFAIERFAGATVVQHDLARARQPREIQHALDLFLVGAVEHRGGERNAAAEVLRQQLDFLVVERRQVFVLAGGVVDALQDLAHLGDAGLRLDHLVDLPTEALRRPAQVHFQDLADVHPRRHAERVEHDVDRRAVGHVRHVLDRHDLGDHALVAVAPRHLVARLQPALDRDVDLDHLLHARRQLVALRQLPLLLLEHLVELHLSCASESFIASSWRAESSPARRMSNQS
jgi:hypothetical protein